ncbi:MAG: hypothetical protein RTU92_01640 [Candidatus Thorarchaeota archaeon]
MIVIITVGTQFEDRYEETLRCEVTVSDDATISDVLEEAKKECLPKVPILNKPHKIPHLYLMHPDTLHKLDEEKPASEYGIKDGSILRLMSAVR